MNYDKINNKFHTIHDDYGEHEFSEFATLLTNLCTKKSFAFNSILDFGCGKGNFVKACKSLLPQTVRVSGYGPATKNFNKLPENPFDIVTSISVLEHIENHLLVINLSMIRDLTKKAAFIVVDLMPALKTLPDGRSDHVMLTPSEWWLSKIYSYFSSVRTVPLYNKKSRRVARVAFSCATNMQEIVLANALLYSWLSNHSFSLDKLWNDVNPIEDDIERITRVKALRYLNQEFNGSQGLSFEESK